MDNNLSNLGYRCKYDICNFPVEGFTRKGSPVKYFTTFQKKQSTRKRGLVCPNQGINVKSKTFSNIRKTRKILNMRGLDRWCNVKPVSVTPYPIVKTIFMMWLQGFDYAPDIVKKCVDTWEFHNRNWNIVKIDESNLKKYLDIDKYLTREQRSEMSPNHYANIIRLLLLKKYGGFWVDATNYCVKPLESWIYPYLKAGFFAYSPDFNREPYGPSRYIANWFIYSEKDNYIVDRWLEKTLAFWANRSKEDYKHWQPVLFYKLVKSDKRFRQIWSKVPKVPGFGPFSPLALEIGKSLPKPITKDKIYNIKHKMSPFYKLSWKYSDQLEPNSVIEYLTNLKLQ